MTDFKEKYQDVWQALRSYFHQDSVSFKNGVSELLNNNSKALSSTLASFQDFLNDKETTIEEKKKFIVSAVDLSFDFHKLDPLAWLQDVARQIEDHLRQK